MRSGGGFLVATFALPALLLAAGCALGVPVLVAPAFVIQFAGLLPLRWYLFLRRPTTPPHLYYLVMS